MDDRDINATRLKNNAGGNLKQIQTIDDVSGLLAQREKFPFLGFHAPFRL